MASPVRQFDAVEDQERLLDVLRGLVSELGRQSALASVGPAAHLDRELGLGSLERVELLVRLENIFGTHLDERVLSEAETIQDLISALEAGNGLTHDAGPGANGALSDARVDIQVKPSTPKISSTGLAQGFPYSGG